MKKNLNENKNHAIRTDKNGINHLIDRTISWSLDTDKFNAFKESENYQTTHLDNSVLGVHMNENVFTESFYAIMDKFSINPFSAENIEKCAHLCGIIAWKKVFDVAPDNMNVIREYHKAIYEPDNCDAVSVAKQTILEKCIKHFDVNRKCWFFEKRDYKIPDKKVRIRHLCTENDTNETTYKTVYKSLFQGVLYEVRKSISSYDTFKCCDGRYTFTLSELDKTNDENENFFDVPVYDRYTFDFTDETTLSSIRDFSEKAKLSDNENRVLEIRMRYTGLGAKAISNSTGIPLGTVKSSLKRLKEKFESFYEKTIENEPMTDNGIYHRTKVSKLFSNELSDNELKKVRSELEYKRYIDTLSENIALENDNPLFRCVPCAKSKNTAKTPDVVTMTMFDDNDLENIKTHCIYEKNVYVSDKFYNNLYTVNGVEYNTTFTTAENFLLIYRLAPTFKICTFNLIDSYKAEKKKIRITSKRVYTFNCNGEMVRTKVIR